MPIKNHLQLWFNNGDIIKSFKINENQYFNWNNHYQKQWKS